MRGKGQQRHDTTCEQKVNKNKALVAKEEQLKMDVFSVKLGSDHKPNATPFPVRPQASVTVALKMNMTATYL